MVRAGRVVVRGGRVVGRKKLLFNYPGQYISDLIAGYSHGVARCGGEGW